MNLNKTIYLHNLLEIFISRVCVKEALVFKFWVIRLTLVHTSGLGKGKACCSIYFFRRWTFKFLRPNITPIDLRLKYAIIIWQHDPVQIFVKGSHNARFYFLRNWEQVYFSKMSYLCGSEVVNFIKDLCICFVLSEACFLDFYWDRKPWIRMT